MSIPHLSKREGVLFLGLSFFLLAILILSFIYVRLPGVQPKTGVQGALLKKENSSDFILKITNYRFSPVTVSRLPHNYEVCLYDLRGNKISDWAAYRSVTEFEEIRHDCTLKPLESIEIELNAYDNKGAIQDLSDAYSAECISSNITNKASIRLRWL